MQLSLHADYACRVLIYLGSVEAKLSSVEEIARSDRISQNHLVKVAHRLAKLGFIDTVRGRRGGLRLSRDPAEIFLGQVIRQTEPGFDLVECFDPLTNTCPIIGVCGLKAALIRAREAFLRELDGVTLADILQNSHAMAVILQELGARQTASTLR